ncbi:MAG TPA: VOC family protein [Limnochordales bacterium]
MVRRLHHIGVAVADMDAAIAFWRDVLGQDVVKEATLPKQGLRLAAIPCGPDGVLLELVAATSPESPVAGFLAQRGEGLHHIALEVDDIERVLPHYEARGCVPLARHPERGLGGLRTLFFHPRSTRRVLVELVDRVGL